MPSTPPSPHLAPWWLAPPENSFGRLHRINWSAILAATAVSFALVVSVIAWIVVHPHKAPLPLATANITALELPVAPPPRTDAISATPAVHLPQPRDGIAKNIPLIEEAPPLLPPPPRFRSMGMERPPWQAPDAPVKAPPQQAGETYGTRVLFHNNQAVAADLARREHKLLFVMHISGNFEDSCFT